MRPGIFLPESVSKADPITVSLQPQCAIARVNICAHVTNPKHWQTHHCLDKRVGTAACAFILALHRHSQTNFSQGILNCKEKKKVGGGGGGGGGGHLEHV